jgi:phosphoglycerate kinase
MKTIDGLNFNGKRAIIRVDFNVPLNKQFEITDDTRMRAAVPTIKKILDDGGSVILMSHLGRPKEGPEDKYSLRHLVNHLGQLLATNVKFADDCIGESAVKQAAELQPGDVLLLENLRFYKEEEKGNEEFAKKLASLADVYVNDAFGTAHRAHASTTIVANFAPEKMFGYLMERELRSIDKVLVDTQKPYTAIIGGAKVSSKIDIIMNLLDKVDDLIIGGGMMFTFIKAQGGTIGSSLVEDDYLQTAKDIMEKAAEKGVKLHIPVDAVVADAFSNDANIKIVKADAIEEGWMGLDIADESIAQLSKVVENSKTVLWNGPMGVFEMSNFEAGTRAIANALVKATKYNGAFTLIGGGDSVAAINQFGQADDVSYVSTGGGALLEYMEGRVLPGVAAIKE